MTFYYPATLRTLLVQDTRMGAIAVDSALRNYARGGYEAEGTQFTVNSVSGNPGSHYACYPVPGGWHVYKFRGTTKWELVEDELVPFFPGAFEPVSLAGKGQA